MVFVGTLKYLEPKLFPLILLHDGAYLIIKILIIFIINACIYILPHNGWHYYTNSFDIIV